MDVISKILSEMGLGHWALVVLVLGIFIDVTPAIKFNPIKAILSWFGSYLNKSIQNEINGFKDEVNVSLDEFKTEVNNRFDAVQREQNAQRETLNKIIKDTESREVSRLKWEIIEFETSIRNEQKHNREQYRHVLDSAEKFQRIAASEDSYVSIPQVDLIAVKESSAVIQAHYDKYRNTQDLYF